MTWQEMQQACKGMLFEYTDTFSDSTPAQVRAMIDAANFAMVDLADVARPIRRTCTIENTGADYTAHDMKAKLPDLMALLPQVFCATTRVEDAITLGKVLYLRGTGSFTVYYKAYPTPITTSTADTQTFDLAQEAQQLVPLYMAARLYLQDDAAVATGYLNEYHARRQELIATDDAALGDGAVSFCSVTGWV